MWWIMPTTKSKKERTAEQIPSSSTVTFSLESYEHVENLTLGGTAAINGTGNVGANVITGNDQANVIDGNGGTDTLSGGDGNDTYHVDGSDEVVEEADGNGTDTVIVKNFAYTLGAGIHVEILKADEGSEV